MQLIAQKFEISIFNNMKSQQILTELKVLRKYDALFNKLRFVHLYSVCLIQY